MKVIDGFKPPAKPATQVKVIEGFKPPPKLSYDSISDIKGEEKIVSTKSIKVGKLNSNLDDNDVNLPIVETGLKPQPVAKVIDRFKPKQDPIEVEDIQSLPSPGVQALTFSQLRNEIEKQVTTNSNSSFIKPKYIKDKSVFYKKSGYLKDLLGEK
jgi:hypothetical protein